MQGFPSSTGVHGAPPVPLLVDEVDEEVEDDVEDVEVDADPPVSELVSAGPPQPKVYESARTTSARSAGVVVRKGFTRGTLVRASGPVNEDGITR